VKEVEVRIKAGAGHNAIQVNCVVIHLFNRQTGGLIPGLVNHAKSVNGNH
jgi:hypothetical protein